MTQKLKGVETPKPQAEALAAPDVGTGTPSQFISELAQVTLVSPPSAQGGPLTHFGEAGILSSPTRHFCSGRSWSSEHLGGCLGFSGGGGSVT